MSQQLHSGVVAAVRAAAGSAEYADYLRDVLVGLIAHNTAAEGDLAEIGRREAGFRQHVMDRLAEASGGAARCEAVPIDPGIASDPDYSPPGYATDEQGAVLPADRAYAGRANLVAWLPGAEAGSPPAAIVHAHSDVVPPWFGPRVEAGRVWGRGACDNKAQIAVLIAQVRLMRQIAERFGQRPRRGFAVHLTLDEEIGGNGSLALAGDPRFAGLPVLMLECTDLVPYCAHRGAVYYRCTLTAPPGRPGAVEMFPLVVRQLEAEGAKLKDETRLPMFTAAHVQTNHGAVGPFGGHPGNVCDHVAVEIVVQSNANPQRMQTKLIQFLDLALREHIRRYGDKTREMNAATGRPKVDRHYDVQFGMAGGAHVIRLDVFGKSGHMAAVAECDNAITKAATLLAAMLKAAPNYPKVRWQARWPGSTGDDRRVVIEGGQGFTPVHRMADVQARLTAAAQRGVERYCQLIGARFDPAMVSMSFDRLHNDAYAQPPDTPPMQALKEAFTSIERDWPAPRGWETSCDARIYHHHGHPVAIFGAGKLEAAHSIDEYVDIADLQTALAVSTLATWSLTNGG